MRELDANISSMGLYDITKSTLLMSELLIGSHDTHTRRDERNAQSKKLLRERIKMITMQIINGIANMALSKHHLYCEACNCTLYICSRLAKEVEEFYVQRGQRT